MIFECSDNEVFNKNLLAMRALYSNFVKQLEMTPDPPWPDSIFKFDFIDGNKGFPTFAVIAPDGRRIYGHSTFDPYKEFEKKFGDTVFEPHDRIIVMGFGFGYHIEHLIENTNGQMIVVVEPFPTLFREAMKRRDLSHIFKSGRVVITVSLDPADLSFVMGTGLSPINLPNIITYSLPYFGIIPTASDNVSRAIEIMKNNLLFNMFTGFYGGHVFLENVIKNFSFAYRNPGILDFKEKLKGKPVFVIAPGPSIERNVELLKEVKGKALIIAVDTATRILLHNGIEPDVISTIDFQIENYDKLKDIDTSFAYLVPAIEVCPEIPKHHKGKAIAYYHSATTASLYDPILGQKGAIGSGGSVLTDAINLATYFGADPLILMGVDLGFPGNRWYADGSFDNGEFTRQLRDGEVSTVEVADVYGNPLVTYPSFFAFLNYLDASFQRAGIKIIDATEGGASIKGTVAMTAADAIEEYVAEGYAPLEILDEIHKKFDPPSPEDVLKKVDKMLGKFKKLQRLVERGMKHADKALELTEDVDKSDGAKAQFVACLGKMQGAKQQIKKMGAELEFLTPLLERSMVSVFRHDSSVMKDQTLSIREKKPAYREVVELDRSMHLSIKFATESFIEHFNKIKAEIGGGSHEKSV